MNFPGKDIRQSMPLIWQRNICQVYLAQSNCNQLANALMKKNCQIKYKTTSAKWLFEEYQCSS